MRPIIPCLWFDNQAIEATKFYGTVFKDAKILQVTHYGQHQPGPENGVMTVRFRMNGQEFLFLNGGPHFKFTEAVSFVVHCKTQKKLDMTYARLIADGGCEVQCGWVTDKFGLSWQVVPAKLDKLANDKDPDRRDRVMHALLKMQKLDIAALEQAAKGTPSGVAAPAPAPKRGKARQRQRK